MCILNLFIVNTNGGNIITTFYSETRRDYLIINLVIVYSIYFRISFNIKSIPKFCYTEETLEEGIAGTKVQINISLELRENLLDARVGSRRGRLPLALYVHYGIPIQVQKSIWP